jgi:DNA-binding NtrC family response regulator
MAHSTILLAIADLFFLSKIKTALEAQGCIVRVATQVQPILKEAVDQAVSLLILDLGISTLDPVQLLQEIRRTEPLGNLPVLCYINHTQVPAWEEKLKDNLVKVVPNSFISSNIVNVVGLIGLFK